MIQDCIKLLADGKDLSRQQSQASMNEIMTGEATPSQIAALITALRIKGETVEEISGFASVMRSKAEKLDIRSPYYVDTCGTGGDVAGTFNISTVAAFVASGAGVIVAKHGNRSVSSKCGSADLLEALGIRIDIGPALVSKCIDEVGMGFIFAQTFHKAMKFAAPTRKEIGIRTVFNILGPVSNPANTKGQLMGVYAPHLTTVMAEVLKDQGCETAMVVCGLDGIDEISVCSPTKVSHLEGGIIKDYEIKPGDLGIKTAQNSSIAGGTSQENARIALDILSGREKGAKRDIVLLNAGAAIAVGRKAKDLLEGLALAKESVDSGKAMDRLQALKKFTNGN
ncbi:MAG: anthranilate phosphoribosyltransferase [Candidatus Margulisiibacteriota bacterium]